MHLGSRCGVCVCVGVRRFCSQAVYFAHLETDFETTASGFRRGRGRASQTTSRPHSRLLHQISNVAFRIRAVNHRDCRSAQIGLEAGTVPSLPRKFRSYAHEALSVSWTHATVLSAAETSSAGAGGIKPGDHLLTFNNEAVPGSNTADWIHRFVATTANDQSVCWFVATASTRAA